MSKYLTQELAAIADWANYLKANPDVTVTLGADFDGDDVHLAAPPSAIAWFGYTDEVLRRLSRPFVSLALQYWASTRLGNQYAGVQVLREISYRERLGHEPTEGEQAVLAVGGAVVTLANGRRGETGGKVCGLTLTAALLAGVELGDDQREAKVLAEQGK